MDENREELYNDMFAYRIMIQDINDDEIYIIKELKIYLIQNRYNMNEINNIIYLFYQHFQINIEMSTIQNITIIILNNLNTINNLMYNLRNRINNNRVNNNRAVNNNRENNNEENNNRENNNEENNNEENNNEENNNGENNNEENNNEENNNRENNNEENNNGENNNEENNNEENNNLVHNNSDEGNSQIYNFRNNIYYYSNPENRVFNNYIYDILLNFIDLRYDNLEDVIVSLDTNDLNNLKCYENNKLNINCCICMETIYDKEIITELKCTHQFHENCIKTYLDKYSYKCPICRESAGNTKNNVI